VTQNVLQLSDLYVTCMLLVENKSNVCNAITNCFDFFGITLQYTYGDNVQTKYTHFQQ